MSISQFQRLGFRDVMWSAHRHTASFVVKHTSKPLSIFLSSTHYAATHRLSSDTTFRHQGVLTSPALHWEPDRSTHLANISIYLFTAKVPTICRALWRYWGMGVSNADQILVFKELTYSGEGRRERVKCPPSSDKHAEGEKAV